MLANESNLLVAQKVGKLIGKMHDAEVIHGDLTTSNLMVRATPALSSAEQQHEREVVVIDFGLGAMQPTIEDKAVDLYVLERAFISSHPMSEPLVKEILEAYRFNSKKGTLVLTKLEQVRQRGRKRDMVG